MLSNNEALFRLSIKPGVIYKYWHKEIKYSYDPHPLVLVKVKNNHILIFSLFTSQQNNKIRYFENNPNIPKSTLVFVKPSKENGLSTTSCINCNDIFQDDVESIVKKFNANNLEYLGILEPMYLSQIYKGINDSLLVKEDMKSIIPTEKEYLDSLL